jgi:hypothetical protein
VSDGRTLHAGRRAGLLLGAALLLVALVRLARPPADGERHAAASPASLPASAAAADPMAEPLAAPARSALAAPSGAEPPRASSGSAASREDVVLEPRPGERELYEGWRARLAADPDELARHAQRVLRSDGPRNERVALLRAAWDLGLPGAPALFHQALRSLPVETDRHAASTADFAVRFLGRRARSEPLAWTTLFDAVRSGATSMEPRLRCSAALLLVESASPADLPRLVALAQEEPESDAVRGLIGALRARSDAAARAALRDLEVDSLALEPPGEEAGG